MKPAFADMLGNDALRERLREDICAGRLPHAYILEGDDGCGKHMLALRLAAALACENKGRDGLPLPCMSCASCRKILSGNSPDVIPVSKGEKATMGVEAVRQMQAGMCISPNELECKCYLIEDAQLMTVQAQNAFLLTLEEPPPYVRFFLLCQSAAPLLETVRSRAPTLRLQPVPSGEIRALLLRIRPEAVALDRQSPGELDELIAAAGGSIGRALELLDPRRRKPVLERREASRSFARLAASRRNSAAVLRFLGELGQRREDIAAQLSDIRLCLRDLLACRCAEAAPLCFFADREEAAELAGHFSAADLLRLCDGLQAAADRLARNANIRLTLTGLATDTGLLAAP